MSKKAMDALRIKYLEEAMKMFASTEDVMRTNSGEFAFPTVDEEGNDQWVVITVKIPTGSRDGDAYDGYSMAEEYAMKTAEKAEKAKEAAAKKAAKIAKDQKMREQKAAAKAAHAGSDRRDHRGHRIRQAHESGALHRQADGEDEAFSENKAR